MNHYIIFNLQRGVETCTYVKSGHYFVVVFRSRSLKPISKSVCAWVGNTALDFTLTDGRRFIQAIGDRFKEDS